MVKKLHFVDGAYPGRIRPPPEPRQPQIQQTKPVPQVVPPPPVQPLQVVQQNISAEQVQQITNSILSSLSNLLAEKLDNVKLAVSVEPTALVQSIPQIKIDETIIDVSSITDVDKFTAPETISIDEEEYDFDSSAQDKLKQLLRRK